MTHGGAARQVRREAEIRYWQGRLHEAFDQAYARWRREVQEWQLNRILTAADLLDVPPERITDGDLVFCVIQHGLPGEATMPQIRVDRRYGPRTRTQKVRRAAGQRPA
jgi:hypothetical protein